MRHRAEAPSSHTNWYTLAHLLVADDATDPEDEWDAASGGNQAIVIDTGVPLSPLQAKGDGVTTLGGEWSGHVEHIDMSCSEALKTRDGERILGFLGGRPDWIQNDETPVCSACGRPMTLAAQLEEGPDYRTAMNFGGGGCGYVFACGCPADSAAFLWQCG